MRASPQISIVTPTHNRAEVLERAIDSVRQQSISDYEHIIIDDCSTDDTGRLVRQYDDPRIRFIRFDQWKGANIARNAGIEMSRASRITFLDSDDQYLPGRLEGVLTRFDRTPSIELTLSSFLTEKHDHGVLQRTDSANPEVYLDGPQLELAIMSYAIFIAGTSISVTKRAIQRSGGFEPTLLRMQDREALLRLSQVCGAQLLSTIDWRKHVSEDSISRPRTGYVESLGRMMESHPELNATYRPLVTYHVARHILCDLIHGRIDSVRQALEANQSSHALRASIVDMVFCYRRGLSMRRQVKTSLRNQA
jgi:glycosyltransferase involved in cell wall biosynthesis